MSGLLEFKQYFKRDIVTPDDEGCTPAIGAASAYSWLGRQLGTERKACIFIFVKDTGDISFALKYARVNDLQVGIQP
jgi:hypothetical protein